MSTEIRDLRVTKIRATPVNVPMLDSYSFSVGRVAGVTKLIIEVETNHNGIMGVGETYPLWTKDIVDRVIGPRVLGENPFNLERLTSKCLPTNANPSLPYVDVYHLLAFGGIEMALWDIMGKACGLPTAMIMGGIYRDKVAFCDYVFPSKTGKADPEDFVSEVARTCKGLVNEHHSPVLEFKVGLLEPLNDIKMVRAVRETVGDKIILRVDANCSWTESTALCTIREFEKHGVANVEEPCNTLAADAKIRRVMKTPISAHSTRVRDVAEHGLDAAVVNPLMVGGFRRLKQQVAIAEDLGLDIWLHSRAELGFATAAYIHFNASTRYALLPSQSLIRPTEDFLTKEGKPNFEKGFITLPDEPGLGVTLDTSKLDKYHQLFNEEGEYNWLNESGYSPPNY